MDTSLRIWMVASECRSLAKVGGLADVVCDLSTHLFRLDTKVTVVMPAYGALAAAPAREEFDLDFAGDTRSVQVLETSMGSVPVKLIRNQRFFEGDFGAVYIDSANLGKGPYEDDAARFNFFSLAVAQLLQRTPESERPHVLHCHDWHTGPLLLLLRRSQDYKGLATIPTLFTIHNLDYQGQRPFFDPDPMAGLFGHYQAVDFPSKASVVEEAGDLTTPECFNPMLTAIRLADKVNTVSPNYAMEITRPDDPELGFVGGRGLESLLAARATRGQLVGLLNGIDYERVSPSNLSPPFGPEDPNWQTGKATHKNRLRERLNALLAEGADDIAGTLRFLDDPDRFLAHPLAVAVTRMASQKVSILFAHVDGMSVAHRLAKASLNTIILGTGELSAQLLDHLSSTPGDMVHVARFDPEVADLLYAAGDLFLMPSDFEPCGISQMIAMAYGTLPLVTPVGGLQDTVSDEGNGFVVPLQRSRAATASAVLERVTRACELFVESPDRFARIQQEAMRTRFTWQQSSLEYVGLYEELRQGPCT